MEHNWPPGPPGPAMRCPARPVFYPPLPSQPPVAVYSLFADRARQRKRAPISCLDRCLYRRRLRRQSRAEVGMSRLRIAIGPCLVSALTAGSLCAAPVAPAGDNVVLVPHRAFYELKLARSNGNRAISSVRGRILYDFSGSVCEGYAL